MSSITKEVNPAKSVSVWPKVKVDDPNVVVGFANLSFAIPALPDKFESVNAVAFIVTVLSVTTASIPEPPANVNVSLVL